MGEIAEDLIDGSACEWCGQYFADPNDDDLIYVHGYPVVCKECWAAASDKERKGHQKALVDTL